ncbi:MAG TPA: DUF6798 domain-containing protein [Bryobacteraceae bacterium]|nr:DUF6798 domain-containing protein [Bryobacteraceae bacterium]
MKPVVVAAAILVLTLLSFVQFPGHTWIQQDTQIYVPILEHLRDPAVLDKDMLVLRPHVTFTLYDEVALGLRRLTGWGFRGVLEGQQVATRALGIWGIYLMATGLGLAAEPALLVAGIFALGAMIGGPAVMFLELEPNPRGFAVPLLVLGVGLMAHARYLAAGIAGAAAFLIHPPTVYPFWGVYFCLALKPSKPELMRRRLYAFVPLLVAAVTLLIASRHQAGIGEAQIFFARLTPEQEMLQRMRASYVYISAWWRDWLPQYLFLLAATAAGYLRVRREVSPELRFFLLGLPLVGLLSMPVSWVLLERLKWGLVPQFQPLRALLFLTLMAQFTAAAAGCRAAAKRRWAEGLAWFALAYTIPVNTAILQVPPANRILVVLLLAAGACLVCAGLARQFRWARPALAAAMLAGFFLIPTLGKVVSYPRLHTPALARLSAWARTATPRDAVFLFANAGKDLSPGIFRCDALRAVYVDWKGGGQVNYLRELGEMWWTRWQQTMTRPFAAQDAARLRSLGIDYVVVRPNQRVPGLTPVFENEQFIAYRIAG